MNPRMAYENLITVKDAAERMHMSRQTIYTLVRAREIAHHRVGGRILLDVRDIDEYMLRSSRVAAATGE